MDLNGAGQFGPTAFDGQARFLEIAVRCPAGSGAFNSLGRQTLNAAPYTFYSQSTGALQGRTVSATSPITGQVLEWNGSQWAPATDDVAGGGGGDITGVPTGTGLIGGGLSGDVTVSVDTTTIQQRVTGTCALGSKIRQINANGTVVCEPSAVTSVTSFGSDVALTANEIGVVLVSGATLVTLPNSATVGSGASYTIKKVDAFGNIISIIGVVDGLSNERLTEEGESLTIVSDGAAWRITGRYLPLNPIKPIVLYDAGLFTDGNLSGRPGADALCTSQRPLGYTKARAFISVNSGDEIRDFPLTYGVPTNQPIRSTSDILIANDWADLLDGTIDTSLGAAGVTGGFYWTGSNGDGSLAVDTCLGWTSASGGDLGQQGDPSQTNSNWLAAFAVPCSFSLEGLLCIAY